MKILWITNIPSPYRVDFFNELGKFCELTVLFELNASEERDHSWENYTFINFTGIVMKGKRVDVDKAICFKVIHYLKNKYNFIFISNLASPTGIIAITYMKMKKIPYIFEGDGGVPKSGKGIKESFKKFMIRNALAYFSTCVSLDEYWVAYGAPKEKLFRYPFTSLREESISTERISLDKKQQLKEELGITAEKVILSVGRFIYGKGHDILIKAMDFLDIEAHLYIVGGIETQEYRNLVSNLSKKNSNIHFIDFKEKEELDKYYNIADLFVLQTRGDSWGLVINEAMAHGLPVITTDQCVAGLTLIKDYENGFIVSVEDEVELAHKITLILENEELRNKMCNLNIEIIKDYTIESMVKSHLDSLTILSKLK